MKKHRLTLITTIVFAALSHGAVAGDAEITLKAGQKFVEPASGETSTSKRQHKPVTLTKPMDKSSPMKTKKTGMHKVGDVTLKRGLNNSDAKGKKGKKGNIEYNWKVEKGEK